MNQNSKNKMTLEYIESLSDEAELSEIALNHPNPEYQIAAIENIHLTDESLFSELIFSKKFHINLRIAAIAQIRDEDLLERIVRETYDSTLQNPAIQNPNFTDEMKLVSIAWDFAGINDTGKVAIEKLRQIHPDSIYIYEREEIESVGDEEVLYEIAKNSVYHDSRAAAIESITDREILLKIATEDFRTDLAKIALEKLDLSDWDVFERIFSSDDNMRLREYITQTITDETLLDWIALNDPDVVVRVRAIENPNFSNKETLDKLARINFSEYLTLHMLPHPLFNNQDIITEIVNGVHTDDVRQLAAKKSEKNEVLADLATNDDSLRVRKEAVANPYLKDENLLKSIASGKISLPFGKYGNIEIRAEALSNPNLRDEDFLEEYVLNGSSPEIRAGAAINPNLKNKELLLDLAINSLDGAVCKSAANNPNLDERDLERIILNGRHYFYFEDLVEKIENEEILENIIKAIDDEKVLWDRHTVKKVKPHESGFNYISAMGLSEEHLVKQACKDKLKIINPLSPIIIASDDVNGIEDMKTLIEIVDNGTDRNACARAVELISDEDILIDLALRNKDKYITRNIVKRIKSQKVLRNFTRSDDVRLKYPAINVIDDLDIILEFLHSDDAECRWEAVRNPHLDDEKLLSQIAIENDEYKISDSALEKIADRELIGEVALKAANPKIRLRAIRMVDDGEIISQIALNDSDKSVKAQAIEMTDNQDVMVNILRSNADIENRCLAVTKIRDSNILFDIICNEPELSLRCAAMENKNFNADSFIEEISQNAIDWQMRMSAVQRIDDANLLREIAENDPMFVVRHKAQVKSKSIGKPVKARPFSFRDLLI